MKVLAANGQNQGKKAVKRGKKEEKQLFFGAVFSTKVKKTNREPGTGNSGYRTGSGRAENGTGNKDLCFDIPCFLHDIRYPIAS